MCCVCAGQGASWTSRIQLRPELSVRDREREGAREGGKRGQRNKENMLRGDADDECFANATRTRQLEDASEEAMCA